MKSYISNALIVLICLVAAVLICRYHRAADYERGKNDTIQSIAACTLEEAHADRCAIPCASASDCFAKNGMIDH